MQAMPEEERQRKELAGLVRVDLTSHFFVSKEDVVASLFRDDWLLFCSFFRCSWKFEWLV